MQIQDPIHGYIELGVVEERLLDTPEVQRLRRVRQLGFSTLVYPSATHTRFEHSLGAFSLASQFAESLELGGEEARELRLAALMHDLGHGPFSHVSDRVFHREGASHEEFSKDKVCASPVADILSEEGIDPQRICSLIDGDGTLGTIVAGHIDVDRMDYLMRDAHYTGVAYGTIDEETIIRAATLHDDTLAFDAKYVNALESLLTARYLMMPTVYMHRTSRVAERMFLEAYQRFEEAENIDVSRLAAMDDPELLSRMRQCQESAGLLGKVENRELYKVAARLNPERETGEVRERALDASGLDPEQVLVDRIDMGGSEPYDVPVLEDDEVLPLNEISPVPDTLQEALERGREIRVYAPGEHTSGIPENL